MIKILLVDDQQLIVEAWKTLLNSRPDFNVVKTASNLEDAISDAKVYRPDIVLLDINLKGDESGFDVCEQLINQMPKTKVIGLSLHDKVSIVQKFISKGASGYLTKNVHPSELILAIDTVAAGNTYICKEIQEKFAQQMFVSENGGSSKELTITEIEVLKLLAQGLTSKEIADQTFVSPRTVETHRHNILKKLDLPNTAKLISWALHNGYLE